MLDTVNTVAYVAFIFGGFILFVGITALTVHLQVKRRARINNKKEK